MLHSQTAKDGRLHHTTPPEVLEATEMHSSLFFLPLHFYLFLIHHLESALRICILLSLQGPLGSLFTNFTCPL